MSTSVPNMCLDRTLCRESCWRNTAWDLHLWTVSVWLLSTHTYRTTDQWLVTCIWLSSNLTTVHICQVLCHPQPDIHPGMKPYIWGTSPTQRIQSNTTQKTCLILSICDNFTVTYIHTSTRGGDTDRHPHLHLGVTQTDTHTSTLAWQTDTHTSTLAWQTDTHTSTLGWQTDTHTSTLAWQTDTHTSTLGWQTNWCSWYLSPNLSHRQ